MHRNTNITMRTLLQIKYMEKMKMLPHENCHAYAKFSGFAKNQIRFNFFFLCLAWSFLHHLLNYMVVFGRRKVRKCLEHFSGIQGVCVALVWEDSLLKPLNIDPIHHIEILRGYDSAIWNLALLKYIFQSSPCAFLVKKPYCLFFKHLFSDKKKSKKNLK